MPEVWINDEFVEESQASVSIRDTGLLHAAGVFTTLRADGRRVFHLEQHLARVRESCAALSIPLSYSDSTLTSTVDELLQRNELPDARLRLTVTRGSATPDPLHGMLLSPTVFLTATALEPYPAELYQRGLTVIALDEQKLNPYDVQAGHKTLNYFSRLAALRAANARGAGEAIWFDVHNYAVSGSISNLFVVKDGILKTPPTRHDLRNTEVAAKCPYPRSAVLPGVMRAVVLEEAARSSIEVRLVALTINDLLEADELFLTNSIMRVMPVCRVERKPIGNEQPGPITARLAEAVNQQIG